MNQKRHREKHLTVISFRKNTCDKDAATQIQRSQIRTSECQTDYSFITHTLTPTQI